MAFIERGKMTTSRLAACGVASVPLASRLRLASDTASGAASGQSNQKPYKAADF